MKKKSKSSGRLHTNLSNWLTLLDSSASSSLIELEGEGVADLLAGGEGEVWGRLAPPKFNPNWVLSWDWLMVVSWVGGIIPVRAASVIWTMDLIIKEGSWRYWDTCVWLWSWHKETAKGERETLSFSTICISMLAISSTVWSCYNFDSLLCPKMMGSVNLLTEISWQIVARSKHILSNPVYFIIELSLGTLTNKLKKHQTHTHK